jgi:radical SAM superfamily enzyme
MGKPLFYLLFFLAFTATYAQVEEQKETSNIQNYTPSKLLEKENGM